MPNWHFLFNPVVLALGWALVAFFSVSQLIWGIRTWYGKVENPPSRRSLINRVVVHGILIDPVAFWIVTLAFFGLWSLTHSLAVVATIWILTAVPLILLPYTIPTHWVPEEFVSLLALLRQRPLYFPIILTIGGPVVVAIIIIAAVAGLGMSTWDNFYWSPAGYKARKKWHLLIGALKELPCD